MSTLLVNPHRLYVPPAGGPEISDGFAYSNGRLSTVSSNAWSDSGTQWNVSTQQVVWSTGGAQGWAFHNTETSVANHWAQMDVGIINGDFVGMAILLRGTGNPSSVTAYRCRYMTSNSNSNIMLEIARISNNSTAATLSTVNTGIAKGAGHTIKASAIGSVLSMEMDGVEYINVSDATLSTGRYVGMYAGMFSGSPNPVIDNFSAGV